MITTEYIEKTTPSDSFIDIVTVTKMGPFWGQSITEMNTTMRVK